MFRYVGLDGPGEFNSGTVHGLNVKRVREGGRGKGEGDLHQENHRSHSPFTNTHTLLRLKPFSGKHKFNVKFYHQRTFSTSVVYKHPKIRDLL